MRKVNVEIMRREEKVVVVLTKAKDLLYKAHYNVNIRNYSEAILLMDKSIRIIEEAKSLSREFLQDVSNKTI